MFTIDIDRLNYHLSVTFLGSLLTLDQTNDYVMTLQSRFVAEIGDRPFTLLVDITNCPLQTQDVMATLRAQVEDFPVPRLTAVVTGQSAVKMQARRVLDRPGTRFFNTRLEAEMWLAAERLTRVAA